MISRIFYSQLPEWARPSYPLMRQALGRPATSRRAQFFRALVVLLILGAVVGLGYAFTLQNTDSSEPTYREFMYFPLVGLQLLSMIFALLLTTNVVALERQKGTWDSLQITLTGAGNSLRVRWALVFYRLRWILLALVIGRLGYVALLMDDMRDFEGRAIDVRIVGIAPEVSLDLAIFLMAALMAAAILQPFVSLAFDGAIGLLIATVTKRRNVGILTTVSLVMARVLISIGALVSGIELLEPTQTAPEIADLSTSEAWARILLLATQGDWSLRLLNLNVLGGIWADIENGIYLGGVVLGIMLAMSLLSNLIVLFAAWRVSKPSRT